MKILKLIVLPLLLSITALAAPPPKLSKEEIQRDWQRIQRFNRIVEDISTWLKKRYPTDDQIAQLKTIYISASALLKKYERRANEGNLQFNIYANALVLRSKALSLERKAFVLRLKQNLNKRVGYVVVKLIGDNTVYIEYDPFLNYYLKKLFSTGNCTEAIRKLGFKRVVFSDGFTKWTLTP